MVQVCFLIDKIKVNLNKIDFVCLGYDIKNKKIFTCNKFLEKGPDLRARSARHFSNGGVRTNDYFNLFQNTLYLI